LVVFTWCLAHLFISSNIMLSARYWKDPHTFNPSRFLADWPRDAFMPFSSGEKWNRFFHMVFFLFIWKYMQELVLALVESMLFFFFPKCQIKKGLLINNLFFFFLVFVIDLQRLKP
jgi:hypothetical protein